MDRSAVVSTRELVWIWVCAATRVLCSRSDGGLAAGRTPREEHWAAKD